MLAEIIAKGSPGGGSGLGGLILIGGFLYLLYSIGGGGDHKGKGKHKGKKGK